MISCRCGAVMVSNTEEWSCPIAGQDLRLFEREDGSKVTLHIFGPHSKPIRDRRLTVFHGPRESRIKTGAPGEASHRPRPFRKPRVHKDKMVLCETCNPTGYMKARRWEEKLKARFAR